MTAELSPPEPPPTVQEQCALAQQALQQVVVRYQWQPTWDLVAESNTLLRVASAKAEPLAQAMARAALNRYCVLWHAACGSQNPFTQRQAFLALHAYLYQTAAYQARNQYACSGDYAKQVAEDIAQTVSLILFQKLGAVQDPGCFLSYAKQVMRHEMGRSFKQAGQMDSLDREDTPEIEATAPAAATEPEAAPTEKPSPYEDAIRRCLRNKEQQQVVIENLLRNKTLQQIADLLGKKSGTIRVLKSRALEKLRTCEEMRKLMNDKNTPARATPSPTAAEPLRHLIQALEQQQDSAIGCEIVERWLPSFVEDEVAGVDVAAKYPDIKRHLDLCPACETRYVELIELTLAEQAGAIPLPATVPAPNLSFLPPLPSFVQVARTLVSQVAQQALGRLAPQALASLPALDDLFFQRLEMLGGTLPIMRGPATTLGPDQDPTDATLRTLSAAYLTTQQVAQTCSAPEIQTQLTQNRLHSTLHQTALRVAQENGFQPAAAQAFAQIYADAAMQNPDAWLHLVAALQT